MTKRVKPNSVNLNPVQYKHIEVKDAKVDEDSRTISGYLSIFNVVDSDYDYIIRGAFAKSITERGPDSSTNRKIAFLWQHDMKEPIGRITLLKEDAIGLYFESELDLGVKRADQALIQLKSGTLNQFSIGYQYVWDKMEYDEDLEAFVCKEINLFEGSVVTLGANEYTFFDGMKSSLMKDIKQKLVKETEAFIKSLPAAHQYECRQIIMKNIQAAVAKAVDTGDEDNGESEDPNLDFIHKSLPLHGKCLDAINDVDGVDNPDLTDCMKEMTDMHTDCMQKMLDIKTDITGGKSLKKPRRNALLPEPIKDLKAELDSINFFSTINS